MNVNTFVRLFCISEGKKTDVKKDAKKEAKKNHPRKRRRQDLDLSEAATQVPTVIST